MAEHEQQQPKKRERKRRGRGEGSIYFDKSAGRWCATVSRGLDGKGKRRRKKVTGATKKEVQDELKKLFNEGPLTDTSGLRLTDYLERWLEGCRPNRCVTTYEHRDDMMRRHVLPYVPGLQLAKLEPVHIEQFYADLYKAALPAPTRAAAARVLVAALNRAVKLRLIPSNPAHGVDRPRVAKKEMRVLDEFQVKVLLDEARRGKWYAVFALLVGAGMRFGEVFALSWSDIDFDKGTVTVRHTLAQTKAGFLLKEPKTASSRRTIVLPSFAVDALTDHRKRQLARGFIDRAVFCTRSGRFVTRQNFRNSVFLPLLKRTGLPKIRLHDLRHTHASALLSKGHSVRAVSARLGHANVQMTLNIYAHVLPNDDKNLAQGVQALYG